MEIIIIAAVGNQNQMGLKGDIPWYVPEDFKHFKRETIGHSILMGRKTFCGEGIKKPLPKRRNIIVSSKMKSFEGIHVTQTIAEGIDVAKNFNEKKLFICGGASIYKESFKYAHKMLISKIDYDGEADVFFPRFDRAQWNEVLLESFVKTDRHPSWKLYLYEKVK